MEEKQETKEINLELRKVVDGMAHICLSCGRWAIVPIFGMFEKESGMLVNIVKGQEEPFVCKPCKKRIEQMEKKEKEGKFLKLKEMDPVEIRMFVREMILPEIVKAVREGASIADGLKQAMGLGNRSKK